MTSTTPQPHVSAKTKIARRDRRNAIRTSGYVMVLLMTGTAMLSPISLVFDVLWTLALIVYAIVIGLQIADDCRASRECE
jgi:hypothetical protein